MAYKAKISEEKKNSVNEFVKLIEEYPIIGVVNMENLPSKQLQAIRGKLRDDVVMIMTKRRLVRLAIEKVKDKKKGIEKIEEYLGGMPALLFTKTNPFKIFKAIQKNKSKSPIKAGQKAPAEIVVPAGPTPFAPGPVISELASLKIKAGVENGKIVIKQDSVVAKEGDEVSPLLSSILLRLGIEPMEIGLDLTAVYEDGTVYDKKILAVDEDKVIADFVQAHAWAFNLSIEAGIVNKDTVELMLTKAGANARAVALESNILTKDTTHDILAKAHRHAASLHGQTQS